MADNNPSLPGGEIPPSAKVQPKKETVRINLPPKPSAAPTIKLPTLPPGGPSASAGAMPPPHSAPKAAAAPTAAASAPAAAAGSKPGAPRPAAPRPVAAPTVGMFDKILAIAAAVAALVALGSTIYCMTLFTP